MSHSDECVSATNLRYSDETIRTSNFKRHDPRPIAQFFFLPTEASDDVSKSAQGVSTDG